MVVRNWRGHGPFSASSRECVQDLVTQWIQSYPCESKASREKARSLQKFFDSTTCPKLIYTNNTLKLGKTCEDLQWNHCTSTATQKGQSAGWKKAPQRYFRDLGWMKNDALIPWIVTVIRSTLKTLSDGRTPYERHSGEPFCCQSLPLSRWLSITGFLWKIKRGYTMLEKKGLPSIFIGYVFLCGVWKGDILVADIGELENKDASDFFARKLNAKEVLKPKNTLHDVKSTAMFFKGRRTGLIHQINNKRMTLKFSGNYYLRPSLSSKGQAFCTKQNGHFKIPLKQKDVVKRTNKTMDMLLANRIDDWWEVDGCWEGTVFTQFTLLTKKSNGDTWSGEQHPCPIIHCQKFGRTCRKALNKKKSNTGSKKIRSSTVLKDDRNPVLRSRWHGAQGPPWKNARKSWNCSWCHAKVTLCAQRPAALKKIDARKTRYACIGAHESTRSRIEKTQTDIMRILLMRRGSTRWVPKIWKPQLTKSRTSSKISVQLLVVVQLMVMRDSYVKKIHLIHHQILE